MRYKETN